MKKNLIILLGLLYTLPGLTQDPLSLSDAILIGLDRNYDLQIQQKNVEIAENNNTWGQAGRWPTINLTLTNNNNLTDNVEVAFPTATQGQTISNSLIPGVNASWTLFDGFRANISKERLDQLQAQTQGNASIVIANTIQAIVLGYYIAVLEEQRLNEFLKQLELSSDRYDYVQIRKELGGATTSDILLEEGNYLTDSLNYVNQELTFRNAIRSLNILIQEPNPDKRYTFTDSLDLSLNTYEYADLESRMLQSNVDLQTQYISRSIYGLDTRLARSDRYPNLSLNAGFNDNRNSLDLSNATFFTGDGFGSGPDERLNSVTDTYFVNFTLSFTLFNGNQINQAINNAIVSEDIGSSEVEKLEATLRNDLLTAIDQYNIRKSLYGINERREEAARLNLQISEDKFKNGSINSFDYRTVQNNYLSAAIVKLQSMYNLMESEVELMRLTGGLISDYQ